MKATSSSNLRSGRCYLKVQSNARELYLDKLPPEIQIKQGDVNNDGTIDVADVNIVINIILGKDDKAQYPTADVNNDGTIDVSDVNVIINIILGK